MYMLSIYVIKFDPVDVLLVRGMGKTVNVSKKLAGAI